MEFDGSSDTGATYAVKDEPPSETVVRAVADAEDADPVELPSLYEAIDPDALDSVFRGRPSGRITFDYYGYTVTVRQNVEVTIRK